MTDLIARLEELRANVRGVSAVTGRLECTWSPRIPSDSGAEQGGLW